MLSVRLDAGTGQYRLLGSDDTLCIDANRYLSTLTARGLSQQTVRSYAYALVRFHRWFVGQGVPFKHLQQSHLVGYVAAQRNEAAKPRTINQRLTVVRSFYHFLAGRPMAWGSGGYPEPSGKRRGRYDRKLGLQWIRVRDQRHLRVKTPRTVIDPLTPDQIEAFLATLHRYRDLALVYMMLLCGLRSRETLSIEVGDINAQDRCLRVFGKGSKERVVPIARPLEETLARYLRYERPRHCATRRLFVVLQGKRRGQPMTAAGLRSVFRTRRRRSRLANANPHRMRHTFGTDMARAGMSLAVLQRLMGHAYPETTMQYVSVSMRDVTEAYEKALAALQHR